MPNCGGLDEISFFSCCHSKRRRYNQFILQELISDRNFLKMAAEGLHPNGFLSIQVPAMVSICINIVTKRL
jgi:hypothetical protein